MQHAITIGIDIAKHVFQVHGVNAAGQVVVRKKLRRSDVLTFFANLEPGLIGMEACATAHHWGRSLVALGHTVKLIPPSYVKPYVKRGKNDAIDAEAICEAVTRPTMRFVPVKEADQQAALAVHRTRSLLIRQRTMLVNALRAHLAEFGIIAPVGIERTAELVAQVLGPDADAVAVPKLVRDIVAAIASQLDALQAQIDGLEKTIAAGHRASEASRRLATIPGVGLITASAFAATVPDVSQFESGRAFAAWLGLTPRSNSSGGKERLGRITKMGDRYLRTLLVVGATSVIRSVRLKAEGSLTAWVRQLLAKKPARLVTVALANKMARIVWALLTRGGAYRQYLPAVQSA